MKRYLQLDFLRGACLLVMTIDHFGELSLVGLFGFISAAEGFVFISGIVSGIVYYRRKQRSPLPLLRKSAIQRAFTLYKYHIICLLALVIVLMSGIELYENFYNRAGLFSENLLLASILNATFLYKIYHLDILPMYVVFLLLLPVGLKYSDSRTGMFLLALSFIFWFVNLFGVTEWGYQYLNNYITARPGNFQILSWQFLFFIGFALGVLEDKGKLIFIKTSKLVFALCASLSIGLFILNLSGFEGMFSETISDLFFSKSRIGALRLVNFLSVSLVICYIFFRFPFLCKSNMLRLLGRHSLYVFTFQTVFLFAVIPFYSEYYINGFLANTFDSKVIRKGITLGTTIPLSLVIFIPAYLRDKRLNKGKGEN